MFGKRNFLWIENGFPQEMQKASSSKFFSSLCMYMLNNFGFKKLKNIDEVSKVSLWTLSHKQYFAQDVAIIMKSLSIKSTRKQELPRTTEDHHRDF